MLFSNTTYHLSPSLPPETYEFIQHILETNGATSTNDAQSFTDVDVVITDTPWFERWQIFKELQQRDAENAKKAATSGGGEGDSWGHTDDGKKDGEKKERWIVTPKWVERSVVLGKVQPCVFFVLPW
jgi:mediator of DNA damage checkpoint protein 1